jgi:hypothetical protein
MQQLTISHENALKAYNAADKKGKELLELLFDKKNFNVKITDRIKTFEDALDMVEVSDETSTLLSYNGTDKDMQASQAFLKLTIIARALNEGWAPDWSNSNQYKYYPWFKYSGSGFRFNGTLFDFTTTYSTGGSRLCFHSEELAIYAGNQFIDLYNQLLN